MTTVWHLTVRDTQEDSTQDHRHVYEDEDEANKARQRAEDAGFHVTLTPVNRHEKTLVSRIVALKGECVEFWCPLSFEAANGHCDICDAPSVITILGKEVCGEHLHDVMAEAENEVGTADKGINTSQGLDRLKYENIKQRTKNEIDRGHAQIKVDDINDRLKDVSSSIGDRIVPNAPEDFDLYEHLDTQHGLDVWGDKNTDAEEHLAEHNGVKEINSSHIAQDAGGGAAAGGGDAGASAGATCADCGCAGSSHIGTECGSCGRCGGFLFGGYTYEDKKKKKKKKERRHYRSSVDPELQKIAEEYVNERYLPSEGDVVESEGLPIGFVSEMDSNVIYIERTDGGTSIPPIEGYVNPRYATWKEHEWVPSSMTGVCGECGGTELDHRYKTQPRHSKEGHNAEGLHVHDPDEEPVSRAGDLHQSVVDKLHPGRFSDMSPQMAAIVGHIVGKKYTDPEITGLNVTSDGFVTGSRSGEEPGKLFVGSISDLEGNWNNLVKAADLSDDEFNHARKLYREKLYPNDWRHDVGGAYTSNTRHSEQFGILYGDDGDTYQTEDGGETWEKIGSAEEENKKVADWILENKPEAIAPEPDGLGEGAGDIAVALLDQAYYSCRKCGSAVTLVDLNICDNCGEDHEIKPWNFTSAVETCEICGEPVAPDQAIYSEENGHEVVRHKNPAECAMAREHATDVGQDPQVDQGQDPVSVTAALDDKAGPLDRVRCPTCNEKHEPQEQCVPSKQETLPLSYGFKNAQNMGCPNCGGTGSMPDGSTCKACFGTGAGGGLMLKGGADDYKDPNKKKPIDPNDPDDEDDDLKIRRFDHGAENETSHAEIHQQEHTGALEDEAFDFKSYKFVIIESAPKKKPKKKKSEEVAEMITDVLEKADVLMTKKA